ncbi:YkgJ family cysteine cluster protein [Aquisalinus flavus]|nr:YkgJ family cysteine cluster protein [Aquisalinus flavus]MBD0426320.1 YkgJ family cysteine cluster protein [Aquisalinus flavus]
MTPEIDCTRCGACCFSSNPHYVQILPQDAGREISPLTVHEANGRQYLNMDIRCGHCALLTLTVDGRLACGDYDNRPEACRAFRAGSFECQMARKHRGHLAAAKMATAFTVVPEEAPGAAIITADPARQ